MFVEIATAVCLMLIIEGILPFLYPGRWRQLVAKLASTDDNRLRLMGLVSMAIGLAVLFAIN